MSLSEKECVPCRGGVPPLADAACNAYLQELPEWQIIDGKLTRLFQFKNFKDSLSLANRVGELAESVNHHPDLLVAWGKLKIEIWTHAINGLTESDFVLAAKIDKL